MSSRRKPEPESKIALPITPMLDMTFQLLFFFIINFRPADLEGQMDMSLPSEDVKRAQKQEDVKKEAAPEKNPTPEFPSDLTVRVVTQQAQGSEGNISAVYVRTIEGKEEPIKLGPPGQTLVPLRNYLKEKQATVTNKEAIKIMGDAQLRIKHLMNVMDVCRNAGFKNISFVSPEL